jgi:hypothetical protein
MTLVPDANNLLALVADRGWPALTLPNGRRIGAGENAWRAFVASSDERDAVLEGLALLLAWNDELGDWTLETAV